MKKPVRKPISKPPARTGTVTKRTKNFNDQGKKRLDEKFADTADSIRVPTPPGKRRVAFRGQYIFVTDDEDEYSGSDDDDDRSKASTAKSSRSAGSVVNKSPSRYSSRSRISEEDEDYYDSDDDDKKSKKASAKSSRSSRSVRTTLGQSNNHLSPNRKLSSKSTKSNKSGKY